VEMLHPINIAAALMVNLLVKATAAFLLVFLEILCILIP
jgi:hypothetical protein